MAISPVRPVGQAYVGFGDRLGKVLLVVSLFFAAVAFLSLFFPKKRKVTLMIPSPPSPALPASQAVPTCTDGEKEKILAIFTTSAAGVVQLGWNARYIRQCGTDVEHVHPFSLFLTVPKEIMQEIFHKGTKFVTSNIMDGIIRGLERERENLASYAASLTAQLGKNHEITLEHIEKCQWKGLVRYLFDLRKI